MFPSCTTQNTLPEPDCDNDAQGVLIVVERNSGDTLSQRLVCQPCAVGEIRRWKMQPDSYFWTLNYQSFKNLAESDSPNAEGNAYRIAAVPEMVKVLELVARWTGCPPGMKHIVKAALAKAKGEPVPAS